MRVTVERVEAGRLAHCSTVGCPFATQATEFGRTQYIAAPIFDVNIDHGPKGRSGFAFFACEGHLTSLTEECVAAANKATQALMGEPPAR